MAYRIYALEEPLCAKCGKYRVQYGGKLCSRCHYKLTYQTAIEAGGDWDDWSFAFCEECGSSLDENGECRNTSCGNSPYQGEDWI